MSADTPRASSGSVRLRMILAPFSDGPSALSDAPAAVGDAPAGGAGS